MMSPGSSHAIIRATSTTTATTSTGGYESSMDWNEDDFKHSNTRGQIAGTAAKAAAATFVKYLRTLLSIGWHLLGYLFEGVMVLFTIIAATFDLFLGWAWVALGEWDRGTEFVFTYSYKEWLNQTYNLAFETEDGRRQRNKIKKAERLQRRTLFEKAVTNGLLKSATEKSLDVSKLDSNSCVVFVFTDIQGSTEAQVQVSVCPHPPPTLLTHHTFPAISHPHPHGHGQAHAHAHARTLPPIPHISIPPCSLRGRTRRRS